VDREGRGEKERRLIEENQFEREESMFTWEKNNNFFKQPSLVGIPT
jgi:hypothetical protein